MAQVAEEVNNKKKNNNIIQRLKYVGQAFCLLEYNELLLK